MYLCSCNFSTVIAGDDECVKFWPESTKKLYALAWGHLYMTTCLFWTFLTFFVISDQPCHIVFERWCSIFHDFFPPTLNSNVIYGCSLWQKEERAEKLLFTNPKRQFRTASRQKIAELIKRTHVEPLEKKEKKIEREPYLQDRRKWGQGGQFPPSGFSQEYIKNILLLRDLGLLVPSHQRSRFSDLPTTLAICKVTR